MAKIKRNEVETTHELATDEKGMRADAVQYARRDVSTVIATFKKIFPKKFENPEEEENMTDLICKSLVEVKYDMIVESRTKKPMWDKFLKAELKPFL